MLLCLATLIFNCLPATVYSRAPASLFYTDHQLLNAMISPDGQHIATLYVTSNNQDVYLEDTETRKKIPLFSTGHYDTSASILNFKWIDNRYIALSFEEIQQGIDNLLDTKHSERLLILDTHNPKSTPRSVRTSGWLAHALPTKDNHFIFAKSGLQSNLYLIDVNGLAEDNTKLGKLDKVDGGQFKPSNEIHSIEGYALRWFLTHSGEPVAAMALSRENTLTLTLFSDSSEDEPFTIVDKKAEEKTRKSNKDKQDPLLVPYALAKGDTTFFCLDANEPTQTSIYQRNYRTGEQKKVYETSSYKILSIITDESNTLIGVFALHDGTVVKEYINAVDKPDTVFPLETLDITFSSSQNQKVALAYVEAHNTPGRFEILLRNQERTLLDKRYPALDTQLKSRQVTGTIANQGLDLPYLLNLPTALPAPFPLIVLPHGGPIGVHDTPYFDQDVQFLVAQGWAVLRVNYRGSSGHGKDLFEAGKKQWGHLILDDIHQAASAVAQRKDIQEDAICLMGFSYGGYAAATLLTMYPDFYRCGVAIAGVYDINLDINFESRSDQLNQWIYEYIGNPEEDYESLKAVSPLFMTPQLQRPIMIAHGGKDRVVDIEQAFRYKFMLNKYQKNHEFYIDDELDHSLNNAQQAVKLMDRAANFIADHIHP